MALRDRCPEKCTRFSEGRILSPCMMGIGPDDAKVVIVGEAPGQVEDKHGKPFVGASGRMLDEILHEVGLSREEVFITNSVRCATYGENVAPTKPDVKRCRFYLEEELKRIKPWVIAAVGGKAMESVLNKSGITKYKNMVFFSEEFNAKVIPIYHPAYVLRNPGFMADFDHGFRILAKEAVAKEIQQDDKIHSRYLVADTEEKIAQVLTALEKEPVFAFDFETNSLDYNSAKALRLSVSWQEGSGVTMYWDMITGENRKRLAKILASDKLKIGHHVKFDLHIAISQGFRVARPFVDTMTAHHLIDENSDHGLDDLTLKYTDMGEYWAELFAFRKQYCKEHKIKEKQFSYEWVPAAILDPYSAKDADATLRIWNVLKVELERQNLLGLYNEHTLPTMEALLFMEHKGIKIDREKLYGLVLEYSKKRDDLEKTVLEDISVAKYEGNRQLAEIKKITKKYGTSKMLKSRFPNIDDYIKKSLKPEKYRLNLNSTTQLGELIFGKENLGIKSVKKTAKKKECLDESVLNELAGKVPFAKSLLEFRQMSKYVSTYLEGIYTRSEYNGRIHTTFAQHLTVSGRLSSRNPNLQNMKRDAYDLKSCFLADEGFTFIKSDLAQAEFRCWAHYSEDEDMIRDIESGMDIHRRTASEVFGIPEEEVTKDQRTAAKNCVSGDTWIPSKNGFVQIKDIKVGDVVLDHFNREQKVLETIVKEDIVYRVSTECGEIVCTANHPFFVINSSGSLITKPLSMLSDRDYILSCTPVNTKRDYITWSFAGPRRTSFKPIFDKWTLDPDLAMLLGIIMAEGSITVHPSHIAIRWAQKGKFVPIIDRLSTKLFKDRVKRRTDKRTGVITWIVTSLEFNAFLKFLGINPGKYKGFKTFPTKIIESPYDVQCAFLRGYFLGDGTFKWDRACVGTVCKDTANYLCLLLRIFGIYPKITVEHPKGGREFYNIQITNTEELEILINVIGFVPPDNWEYPKFRRGRKFIHNVNAFYFKNHSNGDVRYNIKLRKKLPHRFLKAYCFGINNEIDSLVTNGIYSVIIKSIQRIGNASVYDFVTTGDKVMVANGFYTLDCTFGLMYGRGAKAVAIQYDMEVEQAEEVKNLFFSRYPKAKRWLNLQVDNAHAFKAVKNWFGRIRRLPMIDSSQQEMEAEAERQSKNSPIQSLASDMNNRYLVRTIQRAKEAKIQCYPSATIHDANIFQVDDEKVSDLLCIMEDVVATEFPDFKCKMRLDFEVGKTLGTLEKVKEPK